jgi:hypothetical protein
MLEVLGGHVENVELAARVQITIPQIEHRNYQESQQEAVVGDYERAQNVIWIVKSSIANKKRH